MFSHRSQTRITPAGPIRRRLRRSRISETREATRRPTISAAELERLYNYGTLLRIR